MCHFYPSVEVNAVCEYLICLFFVELNPLDYIYHALNIQLQLLDERDPMLKIILKYLYKTSKIILKYLCKTSECLLQLV